MEGKKLNFNAPLLSVRVNRKITESPRPKRQLSLPAQRSDCDLMEVTKPAAVPFEWEQTPGRPKNESRTNSPPPETPSITPRFPPGRLKNVSGEQFEDRTVFRPHIESSSLLNENVKDINMKEESGSQSGEDEFSDALDTLSASESFSWNCSVSGLSGYDGPNAKSSRTFTVDPQTRNLMMTRFLPASRAMVIETPQYVPKKQPALPEQPRPVKKVVSGELRPLLERYASNHSQYKGSVANEAADDEYESRGRKSGKACGLLPRLCVKNSVGLLDPVQGMKSRAQSPVSSGREFRRMARTAYSGPLSQTQNEKHDWNSVYWRNIRSGVQSRDFVENKLAGEANQFRRTIDSYTAEGLSPRRRSRGGGISPYRYEKPMSPFNDGARFLGIPKEIKDNEANQFSSISKGSSDKFRDVSSLQIYKEGSGLFSTFEKTLHIDSVNNAKVPIVDLVSSEAEGSNKFTKETLVESRGMEEFSTPKSFIQGEKGQRDSIEALKHDQELDNEEKSLKCLVLVHPNENLVKKNDQGNSDVGSLPSPRPPPLPKSPSESWLWHTLPSMSLRNPFSHVQSKKQGQKTSTPGAKWETIVKTSHVRHEHFRYSEELISHVPQHSHF